VTTAEFVSFPFEEDKRYELDEGRLVVTDRPPYRHNRVLTNLMSAVGRFLEKSLIGEFLISENVYALSPSTCRSPDLTVILGDHSPELREATAIPIVPEIVAEVICESDTIRTIHRKLKQYFEAGVREAWLIDPDAREIEIWTGPSLPDHALSGSAVLKSPLLPGFVLPLEELFA
jgi:Uma2 family endonuclease